MKVLPFNTPTNLKNGRMSQPWLNVFQYMLDQINNGGGGGGGGPSASSISFTQDFDVDALQTQIDQIQALTIEPSLEAAGIDNWIQFNRNGVFDAVYQLQFAYNGAGSTLVLDGVQLYAFNPLTGGFSIIGRDVAAGVTYADTMTIKAGDDSSTSSKGAVITAYGANARPTTNTGGKITLVAGDSLGTIGAGGGIEIKTGDGTTTKGEIELKIVDTNALKINESGSFGVGPAVDYGVSGYVLTSNGNASAPVWTSPGEDYIRFDYGDLPSRLVFTSLANKTIASVRVIILETFDDPLASISIGISGSPEELMATTDNLPTILGTYEVEPGVQFTSDTSVYLNLSAGTSTTGKGQVVIEYQRSLP